MALGLMFLIVGFALAIPFPGTIGAWVAIFGVASRILGSIGRRVGGLLPYFGWGSASGSVVDVDLRCGGLTSIRPEGRCWPRLLGLFPGASLPPRSTGPGPIRWALG
jgi:hypothetical protein